MQSLRNSKPRSQNRNTHFLHRQAGGSLPYDQFVRLYIPLFKPIVPAPTINDGCYVGKRWFVQLELVHSLMGVSRGSTWLRPYGSVLRNRGLRQKSNILGRETRPLRRNIRRKHCFFPYDWKKGVFFGGNEKIFFLLEGNCGRIWGIDPLWLLWG